ncbi:unnamed protein product [Amoebophrya sp. A25]|nr:unnamed protein product [Amoebophrya sp. A25]|eukprot:GSA25T00014576001.1
MKLLLYFFFSIVKMNDAKSEHRRQQEGSRNTKADASTTKSSATTSNSNDKDATSSRTKKKKVGSTSLSSSTSTSGTSPQGRHSFLARLPGLPSNYILQQYLPSLNLVIKILLYLIALLVVLGAHWGVGVWVKQTQLWSRYLFWWFPTPLPKDHRRKTTAGGGDYPASSAFSGGDGFPPLFFQDDAPVENNIDFEGQGGAAGGEYLLDGMVRDSEDYSPLMMHAVTGSKFSFVRSLMLQLSSAITDLYEQKWKGNSAETSWTTSTKPSSSRVAGVHIEKSTTSYDASLYTRKRTTSAKVVDDKESRKSSALHQTELEGVSVEDHIHFVPRSNAFNGTFADLTKPLGPEETPFEEEDSSLVKSDFCEETTTDGNIQTNTTSTDGKQTGRGEDTPRTIPSRYGCEPQVDRQSNERHVFSLPGLPSCETKGKRFFCHRNKHRTWSGYPRLLHRYECQSNEQENNKQVATTLPGSLKVYFRLRVPLSKSAVGGSDEGVDDVEMEYSNNIPAKPECVCIPLSVQKTWGRNAVSPPSVRGRPQKKQDGATTSVFFTRDGDNLLSAEHSSSKTSTGGISSWRYLRGVDATPGSKGQKHADASAQTSIDLEYTVNNQKGPAFDKSRISTVETDKDHPIDALPTLMMLYRLSRLKGCRHDDRTC